MFYGTFGGCKSIQIYSQDGLWRESCPTYMLPLVTQVETGAQGREGDPPKVKELGLADSAEVGGQNVPVLHSPLLSSTPRLKAGSAWPPSGAWPGRENRAQP